MAWARVYLGMHHALDTAVGIAMGGGALVIAARALWPSFDGALVPYGFVSGQVGSVTDMKIRLAHGAVLAAMLTIASCSEDTQDAVEYDLESAATEVATPSAT